MVAVDIGLWEFIVIFVLVFSLFLLIVGIFTAYFGTGKSRAIGAVLLIIGIVLAIVIVLMSTHFITKDPKITFQGGAHLKDVIINTALVLVGAVLGAIVAIGMFLVAIMKS